MNSEKIFNLLTLSSIDLAGQIFNGYDLTNYLNKNTKLSASMGVWSKSSSNPHITSLAKGQAKYANKFSYYINNLLSLDNLLALGSSRIFNESLFINSDIVHLQLIHLGLFMSPFSLHRISKLKPTVWTIHDMWPITGACQQSLDCNKWISDCQGKCPMPRVKGVAKHYTPRLLAFLKKLIFLHSDIHLVVASDWMREKCLHSSWAKNKTITKIPFGVNTNIFAPHLRNLARKTLSISENEIVIAFRGLIQSQDRFKGIKTLIKALSIVTKQRKITLLIFQNSSSFEIFSSSSRLLRVGWLTNPIDVANCLSAADLFLMPSRAESFGLMAIEAMSCGTPVISSNAGALPEHVKPPTTGLIFKVDDSNELADNINYLLDSPKLRKQISLRNREHVLQEYSFERYVNQHISLYNKILFK